MELLETGTLAGIGSFRCESCDYMVVLAMEDQLPECPSCGSRSFRRQSMFGARPRFAGEPPQDAPADTDHWLHAARRGLAGPGQFIAFEEDGGTVIVPLTGEWTRIGRSLAADIRFDDPTVSRRHALIVRQPDEVRVLDDRSLNGVFVNGRRVEWSPLRDGDEILVGRHCLRFLDVPASRQAAVEPGFRPDGIHA